MDKEQMLEGFKKGVEAVVLSIEKWEDIAYRDGKEFGKSNCALCWVYNIAEEVRCAGCPIKNMTQEPMCDSTPYEEWVKHKNTENRALYWEVVVCEECFEIALKEIDFLTKVNLLLR